MRPRKTCRLEGLPTVEVRFAAGRKNACVAAVFDTVWQGALALCLCPSLPRLCPSALAWHAPLASALRRVLEASSVPFDSSRGNKSLTK
jgi:hypothetical protein